MRALIDTCVIIDALQHREPFCQEAEKIFLAVANKQFIGFLTAKSSTDIYYLTYKCTHNNKKTRCILKNLFELFVLADTMGLDCRQALYSEISDFEDAVMIESALRIDADCIVTRNIRDYEKSPIKVYSPAEFLEVLEEYSS